MHVIETQHGKPVFLPTYFGAEGKRAARQADGDVGMGLWKKRMPVCNGSDRGFNVTPPEREQTSTWSLIARRLV